MKSRLFLLALAVFTAALAAQPVPLQPPRKSPHETISRKAGNNRVTIVYGRPYTKDPRTGETRKIWGGLVPYDKIWRLGADEATLFITQKPLDFGGVTVPAGAYSLFLLPSADGSAQLIVNREIGQWGIDPYHTDNELARLPLEKRTLAKPVEQFTMGIDNGVPGGGLLTIAWENIEYIARFAVKK